MYMIMKYFTFLIAGVMSFIIRCWYGLEICSCCSYWIFLSLLSYESTIMNDEIERLFCLLAISHQGQCSILGVSLSLTSLQPVYGPIHIYIPPYDI